MGLYLRKLSFKKTLAIKVMFCLCFAVVKGQNQSVFPETDTLKTLRLKEVSVKDVKSFNPSISPVPVQILTVDDLQKINSLSVADAVRYLSGLQLKDYGGIGGLKTIDVRSIGTNHTAVFYNGLPIGNAQNGQVDLGKFSLENIEEIVLYNGQNPQLLQPASAYASANALYLKSKDPLFSDNKKYASAVAIKTGTFGLFNPSASFDYKWSDNISSRLSAAYLNANGKYKFTRTNGRTDTTATRQNGDVEAFRLEYDLFGKIETGKWQAKVYRYQSERGLPRAIVANNFDATQRQWDENTFVQAGLEKQLSKCYSFAVFTKYAYDYQRYLDPEYIKTTGFLDNKYHQHEFYFSLSNNYKLTSFWSLALAADYKRNTLDANIDYFAYPERNTLLAALTSSFYFSRLNAQLSLLGTTVNEKVKLYNAAGNKQEYTPTFMFSWQPFAFNDSFRIRGFYKSVFRMPTFNELYYTLVGNTFLRPEYVKQYNLGFTFKKASSQAFINTLSIQLDAYHNNVTDKIVAIPSNNLFRWTMVNLNKVEIKGLETNIKLSKYLSENSSVGFGLSYTYQQAIDLTEGGLNYRHNIPYVPSHNGSLIASFACGQSLINYSFLYTGERYAQKSNTPDNYIEPWYTHDISLQHMVKIKARDLTLRAEINNLLNQYFDVIKNFPMPGRSYRFSIHYKI